MKRNVIAVFCALAVLVWNGKAGVADGKKITDLPAPSLKGAVSLEEAIQKRRSVRAYSGRELGMEQIGQLLWAAQGVTLKKIIRRRSAPSAGAVYPMETYLLKKDGIFRYRPETHSLETVTAADLRKELSESALGQRPAAEAPVSIAICAVYEKLAKKYGEKSRRFAHMEAGHIAQNIHLQAAALGLGSVPIGAFDDEKVKKTLMLPSGCEPLYIIAAGYPAD